MYHTYIPAKMSTLLRIVRMGSWTLMKWQFPMAHRTFQTFTAALTDDQPLEGEASSHLLSEFKAQCRRREVEGAVRSFTRLVDSGRKVPLNLVGLLVNICGTARHIDGLDVLYSYLALHTEEGVGNALLSAMVSAGQRSRAISFYQMLVDRGLKVRVRALFALLTAAAEMKETRLAVELLAQLQKKGYVPPQQCCEDVMRLAVESGEGSLVEGLLSVLRAARSEVEVGVASLFTEWVQRLPGDYVTAQTSLHTGGVCAACGHYLERNSLSAEEHRKLFEHYDRQLTASVNSFENNRKDQEEVLMFRRMMNTENPPLAVVDGLNMVYLNQNKRNLLFSVASQLTSVLQGPVLIIARQHITSKFVLGGKKASSVMAIQQHFRPKGIHFFFTRNRVEDDLFFLYACFSSGHGTYFVSNDNLGDHACQLPQDILPLFEQWQRSHQVRPEKTTYSLVFPQDYERVVQWTDTNWHLPLAGCDMWLCTKQLL